MFSIILRLPTDNPITTVSNGASAMKVRARDIASAATSAVIGHIAAGTKTIRVGAGGIMLPNHAPYVVAEQFGTLARLFPGRIDLGLGTRDRPAYTARFAPRA
jgi:alkanesulfonate monooxygenase SsuD/methylene tetrahydromethanopterin reductase-like flavin-dependent oxidoreductase (luciferase family)